MSMQSNWTAGAGIALSLLTFSSTAGATPCAHAAAVDRPTPASDEQDPPEGSGWSMERLDLEISIMPAESILVVEGTALLKLDAESSHGPALQMQNIVRGDLFMEAEALPAQSIEPGGPRRMRRIIRFDETFKRGDELEVSFAYESAAQKGQLRTAPQTAFGSWVEFWYPCPVPADASDARYRHAPGTTTFHLPLGWKSVTNGALLESSSDDVETTEVWECDLPVARSYAAGPYKEQWYEAGGRKIGVYLLSEKPMSAAAQAEILSRALDAMEERFGPYPYPSYVIAEIPDGFGSFGASSEQGFIMCKPEFFEVQGGNLPLFAHEAAHGWWGNLVSTTGAGSILCSESLAQYGAVLAIEGLEGAKAATEFLRFSREGYIDVQCARGYFELARRGNDMALSKLGGGGWQHSLSDAKGHWFFHMLRGRIGDELFFATLRGILDEYAGRMLSLDELRAAFVAADEDSAGMRRFLAQWLDRPGVPIIEVEIEQGAAPALLLRQVQAGDPYELELEVDLLAEDGSVSTRTVESKERLTRVSLAAGGSWREARVDPRHRLLIWKPEYGERP